MTNKLDPSHRPEIVHNIGCDQHVCPHCKEEIQVSIASSSGWSSGTIQINKPKNMNTNMMSLYDYLGRAAGPDLGQQVAQAAARKKVKFKTRYVEQGGYSGDVMLYPKTFLDEYFGGGTGNSNNKQMLFG